MEVGLDPQQLGLELGTGAVIGAVMGFAAKKIAKLIAVIVGIELAVFKFLESRGILSVDWDRLSAGVLKTGEAAQGGTPPSWVSSIISTLSIGAGFTGGFMVGFKKG
ncbi:FUN14 domain-containing protein [Halorussus litoreus]|uniref:FUN14 domain-containing protein n=1 Tax=Halorussus litoreus TaxID=1710536 RepID=UPI000E28A19D|nr:FUN14 domain-containing protein [Halorussus litoreus]